jgi:hypothetical protein
MIRTTAEWEAEIAALEKRVDVLSDGNHHDEARSVWAVCAEIRRQVGTLAEPLWIDVDLTELALRIARGERV